MKLQKKDPEVEQTISDIIKACKTPPTSKQKTEIRECFYEIKRQKEEYLVLKKKRDILLKKCRKRGLIK